MLKPLTENRSLIILIWLFLPAIVQADLNNSVEPRGSDFVLVKIKIKIKSNACFMLEYTVPPSFDPDLVSEPYDRFFEPPFPDSEERPQSPKVCMNTSFGLVTSAASYQVSPLRA